MLLEDGVDSSCGLVALQGESEFDLTEIGLDSYESRFWWLRLASTTKRSIQIPTLKFAWETT